MFDPEMLDDEARALWDEFMRPESLSEGEQFALWSFGYICTLQLGHVPEIVTDTLHPDTGPSILAYWKARTDERHARYAAEKRARDTPDDPAE